MLSLKKTITSKFNKSLKNLSGKLQDTPEAAIIAGSGITDAIKTDKIHLKVPFSEIDVFPETSVEGHKNELIVAEIAGKIVLVFTGRFHFYEGRSLEEVCSQVILTKLLGIDKIIITNSAGGLNPEFRPGDIMRITGTINLFGLSPAALFESSNLPLQNFRNTPVANDEICSQSGEIIKEGIYAGVQGPNYETRAEIRMLRTVGADAVGMSTVLETDTAKLLGMRHLAFSLITNMAKETSPNEVSHAEVLGLAAVGADKLTRVLKAAISLI
jgi:purine-nucleoside phosphorylase